MTRPPLIAYADGPSPPTVDPLTLIPAHAPAGACLLLGWMLESPSWIVRVEPGAARTIMGGYGLSEGLAQGRIDYFPLRLGAVPRYLTGGGRPALVVVTGRPLANGFAFTSSPGWAHAAAQQADAVIVDVDEDAPELDAPVIPGKIVLAITSPRRDGPQPRREVSAAERTIGELVASVMPRAPVVQYGPGGVGEAVLAALRDPVQIQSGLVTDAVADLDRRGLLRGVATAAYAWGTEELAACSCQGRLRLRPVQETHNVGRLSSIDRFVAVNTALEVGLDGAINVERVGGRVIAGIGGHPDFCAAAVRSAGGLSVVATPATRMGQSTIVPTVASVSTPGTDVQIVITEYGIADLRGANEAVRARRLIAVAAPEHREQLTRAMRHPTS